MNTNTIGVLTVDAETTPNKPQLFMEHNGQQGMSLGFSCQ